MRAYLARKLNCAPMRISKKFAGRCIGKLVFNPKLRENISSPHSVTLSGSAKLSHLEESYRLSCNIDDDPHESLHHFNSNGGKLNKNPIYSPIRSHGGSNNKNRNISYHHGHYQNGNGHHNNNLHYTFGPPNNSNGSNMNMRGISNSSSDGEGSSSSDDDASRYYMNALNRGHNNNNNNHDNNSNNGWQDESSMMNSYYGNDSSPSCTSTHDLTSLMHSTFDNEHNHVGVDLGLFLNAGDSQIPLEPEEWRDVLSFFCPDSSTTNLASGGIPHNIFNVTKVDNLVNVHTYNNGNNSNNNDIDLGPSPPGVSLSSGGVLSPLPLSNTKQQLSLQNQLEKTKSILFKNNVGSTNSNRGMGLMKPSTSSTNSRSFTNSNSTSNNNSSTTSNVDGRLINNNMNLDTVTATTNNSSTTPTLTNEDMHKAATLLKVKLLNSFNGNSNGNSIGFPSQQASSQPSIASTLTSGNGLDNGINISSNAQSLSSVEGNSTSSIVTNDYTPLRDRAGSNLSLGIASGTAFADIVGIGIQ